MVRNEYVIFYFILHNRRKSKYNIKEVENIFLKIKKNINKFFLYIYIYIYMCVCVLVYMYIYLCSCSLITRKCVKLITSICYYKRSVSICKYNGI